LSGDTDGNEAHPELGRGPQNGCAGGEEHQPLEALWKMQCVLGCQRATVRHANKTDPLSLFQRPDEFIQPSDEVLELPDWLGANALAELSDLIDCCRSILLR
jgi:hypothetical protein